MNKIDTEKWQAFKLYEIFEIDAGTKLDKINMKTDNPEINFVGRSNFNNGITEVVNKIEDIEPYAEGNLTLALGGAYLGSCFVQNKVFYTSQNVFVLKPKYNMSLYAKQFIATCIFKESQLNYRAFEKELNKHIKTGFKIYLPIVKKDTPDWNYMDNYMLKLNKEMIKKVTTICNINIRQKK